MLAVWSDPDRAEADDWMNLCALTLDTYVPSLSEKTLRNKELKPND